MKNVHYTIVRFHDFCNNSKNVHYTIVRFRDFCNKFKNVHYTIVTKKTSLDLDGPCVLTYAVYKIKHSLKIWHKQIN